MKTPHEQGREQGTWTPEMVAATGFSVAACLENEERLHAEAMRDEIPGLCRKNPGYAKEQAEFRRAYITATRESLREIIAEEN